MHVRGTHAERRVRAFVTLVVCVLAACPRPSSHTAPEIVASPEKQTLLTSPDASLERTSESNQARLPRPTPSPTPTLPPQPSLGCPEFPAALPADFTIYFHRSIVPHHGPRESHDGELTVDAK